ncbi:MAG: tetratricopeptide repeat protein [Rhodospirillales bacterium]|nr:tetratricopeptide repeat protein [Rhodospirillales bacterium]
MQHPRSVRRSVLLALTLLSACAAAEPSPGGAEARAGGDAPGAAAAFGPFLIGRVASMEGDFDTSANELLRALAHDPRNQDLRQQAFLATLLAGQAEAVRIAHELPDNQTARLLLGNADAKAGRWQEAEQRFAGLPRQGLIQVLQPLLIAWSQFGAGHPDTALETLRPLVEGQQFRAVYAFHAAMIADLSDRAAEAGRLYGVAQAAFGTPNLDVSRSVASWQARGGHADEARRTLAALAQFSDDLAVAVPRLQADVATRPVRRATDGLAEAYLALAAALRQQDAEEFAAILLRLSLDLRPDLTTARLLAADLLAQNRRPDAALAMLAPVPAGDPLAPVVDLRRVAFEDRAGNSDAALRLLARLQKEHPDRPESWAMEGAVLRGQHRYLEAVTAYDHAVTLLAQPTQANWPLFYERGIAEERAHQWPKAEADFEHALQLSPNEPFVLNYLGYSWAEQGMHLAEARQMIERAAQARPNDGAIVDSLGWIALREGHIGQAVRDLEKAVELQPEDPTINGHLGDAYWAAGRKLEALYQWQRALSLNPEPEDVPKLEAKLHDAQAVEQPKQASTTGATTAQKVQ